MDEMNTSINSGALFDLKIIDLGHYIAGPYCASLLAGLGAEVIKIERPRSGDGSRQMGPFPNDEPHLERSGLYHYLNLGKKSLTLNLKSEAGRDAFKKLVARADILIENFAPRVMPSLGLEYKVIKEINPSLIMTSISNFGQTGPYRDYKGFEITLNALGGVQAEIGEPDREPLKLGGQQLQFEAGLTAAISTMGALCGRDFGGTGQHIDTAIVEIAATIKGHPTMLYQFNGHKRIRNGTRFMALSPDSGLRVPWTYPIAMLPCKDGYICIDCEMAESFDRLCEMIGRPDLLEDPRFSTPQQRGLYADELDAILIDYLKIRTKREIFEEASDWRIPTAIMHNMAGLFHDSQHRERKFFARVDHPLLGEIEFPGHIFLSSENSWQVTRAPLLGEHNREILIDRLGYSEEECAAIIS